MNLAIDHALSAQPPLARRSETAAVRRLGLLLCCALVAAMVVLGGVGAGPRRPLLRRISA